MNVPTVIVEEFSLCQFGGRYWHGNFQISKNSYKFRWFLCINYS